MFCSYLSCDDKKFLIHGKLIIFFNTEFSYKQAAIRMGPKCCYVIAMMNIKMANCIVVWKLKRKNVALRRWKIFYFCFAQECRRAEFFKTYGQKVTRRKWRGTYSTVEFRKLFETSEVSEFAEVRTTASSVSQTYEDTWGILGLLREWLYTWEDAKLLDVPALNNFHKVDTLFWKFRYTVNRIFWLFSKRYCRQGLNQIIPEMDKY